MKVQKRSVFISLLGSLFHYYAFSVYAFSAVILAPIFFHTESDELTRVLGLVTFSITFLLKPIGSIIFGHIGDKYGRKAALTQSLVAITIATTCIGLIPSYAQIGWASSALLLLCLLVQGLCVGGQYTGAIIYIQEHMKQENAALGCGIVAAIGIFGTLLGTATSYFFDHAKGIEGWEWRLPFLLSAIMGIFLYALMKTMKETPVFLANKAPEKRNNVPLVDVIRNYKRPLFSAVFISSIPVSMFYLATVYIPNFYYFDRAAGNYDIDPLGLACLTQILCIILSPTLGIFSDKFGRETQLRLTSILLIISPIFIFYYMTVFSAFAAVMMGVVFFSFCSSLYAGPAPAYLSQSFPVVGRYSGMGLGIAIGEGLFGGLSPIICVGLEQFFESTIAPAYFVMGLGALSLLGILLARKPFPDSQQKKSG